MAQQRSADVVWEGNLARGRGTIQGGTGVLRAVWLEDRTGGGVAGWGSRVVVVDGVFAGRRG